MNVWKILGVPLGVQLINFFRAIREILKNKIYGGDKGMFLLIENKGGKPSDQSIA